MPPSKHNDQNLNSQGFWNYRRSIKQLLCNIQCTIVTLILLESTIKYKKQ